MTGERGGRDYVSDELTHLVGWANHDLPEEERKQKDFLILRKVLNSRKLLRGRKEGGQRSQMLLFDWDEAVKNGECVLVAAVCFCDIPLNMLGIHMEKYGCFGVGFTKKYMVSFGCNPVYYVRMKAPCTDWGASGSDRETTFGELFRKVHEELRGDLRRVGGIREGEWGKWSSMKHWAAWFVLGHTKLFCGTLGESDQENYYMEREWRVIGDVDFGKKPDGLEADGLENVARVIVANREYEECVKGEFGELADERKGHWDSCCCGTRMWCRDLGGRVGKGERSQ